MGALINVGLNLDKLDKSKIVKTKNGNFYNITVSVNDTTGQYGHNASVFNTLSREERDAKVDYHYVGNGKVVWTDGKISVAETKKQPQEVTEDIDLPF